MLSKGNKQKLLLIKTYSKTSKREQDISKKVYKDSNQEEYEDLK